MFNKKDYLIDYQNQSIKLLRDDFALKKITGTHLYALSKLDEDDIYFSFFSSAISRILNVSDPIANKIYVSAGQKYEDLIEEKIDSIFPGAKIQHINAKEVDFDYFKENSVFGGVPDFLIEHEGKKIVLDVKTARRRSKPLETKPSYVCQVNLYRKLLNFDKAMLLYVILDYPYDYTNLTMDGKTVELRDVTVTDEKIEMVMQKAKQNLDLCLDEKEIKYFDLRENYPLLQLLEAENDIERLHRKNRIMNSMSLSWYKKWEEDNQME